MLGLTTALFRPLETLDVLFGDEPGSPEGYCDILRQGDDTSYIIGVQFFDRYRSSIPITSFYEMKPFRDIKYLGKVVNKKSATLKDNDRKFNHRERRVGLNADHNGIVKFPRADRGLGYAVLAEIKCLADEVLASGSTRGLASGSTDTGTGGGASGPSQSAPASWQEGSVQYFGDYRDDIETQQDKSIESTDDRIDTEMRDDDGVGTEMLEAEFKDKSKLSSTSYSRRVKASSSGPNFRRHEPFNTHATPEFATRSNIDHNQLGLHTTPTPPFCFECALSKYNKCPSHCKDCLKNISYPSLIPSLPGNNKNRQPSISLPRYCEEAELCQQHKREWSKVKYGPGSQRFLPSKRQPPFDQHKYQIPGVNAPSASLVTPQTSLQDGLGTWNRTPPRRPYSTPPPIHLSQRKKDERVVLKGLTVLQKTHQDHSGPFDAHTLGRDSRVPAQGIRRSERIDKYLQDLPPVKSTKSPPGRGRDLGLTR